MHQPFETPHPPTSGIGGASGDVHQIFTIFYGPGVRGLHYCFIFLPLEAGTNTYPQGISGAFTDKFMFEITDTVLLFY